MKGIALVSIVLAGVIFTLPSATRADIPAPPVNQSIGMDDVLAGNLSEADCRACHTSGLPNRHHLLYGQSTPVGSIVPYPDSDGNGSSDPSYGCLNCHNQNFTVVRDCVTCHTSSAHHTTPDALSENCVSCHGGIVARPNDGHYIPTYAPSLVTPGVVGGDGLPLNSRGNGAGACDYCHDADGLVPPVIRATEDLHHAADQNCSTCHAPVGGPYIRNCEACHSLQTLHNIQADSPNPNNLGTIVVGGESAGYGHVGRDAGPANSDCWGCHGFSMASAPGSGPIIPTVYGSDLKAIDAGTDTTVVLTGSSFTNVAGGTQYESDVVMTAADGSSMILTPDLMDQGALAVTIPGTTASGNYSIQAVKAGSASNPVVISIKPQVIIDSATGNDTLTIIGSGFGGYARGSGTSVTATKASGKKKPSTAEEASIVSWSDTRIEARFGFKPKEITVNSVFGSATAKIGKAPKPGKSNH